MVTEKGAKMSDLIYRQSVLDIINSELSGYMTEDSRLHLEGIGIGVEALPTIEEHKTGLWIKDRRASLNSGSYEVFVCSECESAFNWRMRYCGHCGAKMEVEHEVD